MIKETLRKHFGPNPELAAAIAVAPATFGYGPAAFPTSARVDRHAASARSADATNVAAPTENAAIRVVSVVELQPTRR
ncbi:hypothetical protein [Salana multivorans]